MENFRILIEEFTYSIPTPKRNELSLHYNNKLVNVAPRNSLCFQGESYRTKAVGERYRDFNAEASHHGSLMLRSHRCVQAAQILSKNKKTAIFVHESCNRGVQSAQTKLLIV